MKISIFLTVFSLLMIAISVDAQMSRKDSLLLKINTELTETERIKTLHSLFGVFVNNKQDSALLFAKEAFEKSANFGDNALHGQSIMNLVHAYYANNFLDSSKQVLLESIPFFEQTNQYFFLSASYRNLAVIAETLQLPDSSLAYLDKCLEVLREHPDSIVMGDVYLSKGLAYNIKGYYELSADALLQASRIFEIVGNDNHKGYALLNLGITYEKMKKLEEGLDAMEKAMDYFNAMNNWRAATHTINNIGNFKQELGRYAEAEKAFKEGLHLAKLTEQPFVEMNANYNLGKLFYRDLHQPDSSLFYFKQAIPIAEALDDKFVLGEVNNYSALIAIDAGDSHAARNYVNAAEGFVDDYPNLNDQESILSNIAAIHEKLGNKGRALDFWKKAKTLQDSLYNERRDKQAEELNIIYETEKKDAEILLLNKTVDLEKTKKRAFRGGILLLALLAGAIIFGLNQRRKKEASEKKMAQEKRKIVEEKLETKKKELTNKALQLAKKNEFLLSLEGELEQLKSTVDSKVNNSSKRIQRMIRRDSDDDELWEQFGKEFTTVHQDFMDRLKAEFGSFSKSEMRLIALLKMNLSSKDIAHTLRVSDDGVKKARYRLRKKMNLDSDIDIQSYILNF